MNYWSIKSINKKVQWIFCYPKNLWLWKSSLRKCSIFRYLR